MSQMSSALGRIQLLCDDIFEGTDIIHGLACGRWGHEHRVAFWFRKLRPPLDYWAAKEPYNPPPRPPKVLKPQYKSPFLLPKDGEVPSNRTDSHPAMVRTLKRTTSYVYEDQIFVGFQDVVQTLLDELLKVDHRRRAIPIYGMGGLGKTTLVRNLYTSPNIVSSFPTQAWICVSQE
ncbi:hypothetical protein CQW23_08618 [Capsicum baccatum]|uniref:NB-ARC domain-containing protein n=1 Tax=Capsicum baccatum TaxID=33114 RepID=A0A2G2X9H2_CAPBA|nr:hypothetical protein CQW23_08618 [Capsicum baccatum]